MPTKPPRPCNEPGCGVLTATGRCAKHRPSRDRGSATQQGYGYRWQLARRRFLAANPACVDCGAPATEVDHIIPHKGNAMLFWSQDNWAPRCRPCHSRKTAKEGRWG